MKKAYEDANLINSKNNDTIDLFEGDKDGEDLMDGEAEAIELRYRFKQSQSYFRSYLARTFLEMVVGSALLAYMVLQGIDQSEPSIWCA